MNKLRVNHIEAGKRRVVWMPLKLDELVEASRFNLGLSRSAFYRTAALEYLKHLSVLTAAIQVKEASG